MSGNILSVRGTLTIDNKQVATGKSIGGAKMVNRINQIYMGGVPKGAMAPSSIPRSARFIGGIGSIEHATKKPDVLQNITPGYVNGLKNGLQIGTNGGHAAASGLSEIGRDFSLSMKVSSRHRRGYLLYVKAEHDDHEDFLAVYIDKGGGVTAKADNGGGPFSVTVKPPQSICNGELHHVLLSKKGTTLFLAVGGNTKKVTSVSPQSAANTGKAPYFFGGIPDGDRPNDYEPFTGCIESIAFGSKQLKMADYTMNGEATPGCANVATI